MKNNIIKYLACAAMALGLAGTMQAAQITGNIGLSGTVDQNTTTCLTSTTILAWHNIVASTSLGTINTLVPNLSTLLASGNWNYTVSVDINPLWWYLPNGVQFEIQSYSFTRDTVPSTGRPEVTIGGFGIMRGTGFDATPYDFNMTIQDPPSSGAAGFTFSASQAPLVQGVPDGGMTVMLLGAALSGLALIRRKLA